MSLWACHGCFWQFAKSLIHNCEGRQLPKRNGEEKEKKANSRDRSSTAASDRKFLFRVESSRISLLPSRSDSRSLSITAECSEKHFTHGGGPGERKRGDLSREGWGPSSWRPSFDTF